MKKFILILAGLGFLLSLNTTAFSQNNLGKTPLDGVYHKTNTPYREPVPYPSLREADVMWAKRIWRVVDMRQKINLPFYYPLQIQNGRKSFMRIIYDAVKEGTITAYGTDNEEFLTPITAAELSRVLDKVDTLTLTRSYPPYDMYDTVINQLFDPTTVYMFRIKEDWFFDKQRSVMDVRIIGICPITEEYDVQTNEYKGTRALFWIYFPDCRPLFARNEVYNRWNDEERRTYDDIFMKRFFGSYIYKESNVYDRKISQYAKGVDALLEADRIKAELYKTEEDLWEY